MKYTTITCMFQLNSELSNHFNFWLRCWFHPARGGLSSTSSKESQMGFPTTICSEAGGSSGSYVVYGAAAASGHGRSTSDVEIQFPWGSSALQQNKQQASSQQQKASSPRSSSITTTTTTSLGSNMLEFSNNSSSSPREVGMQSCFFFFISVSLEEDAKLIYPCAYAS